MFFIFLIFSLAATWFSWCSYMFHWFYGVPHDFPSCLMCLKHILYCFHWFSNVFFFFLTYVFFPFVSLTLHDFVHWIPIGTLLRPCWGDFGVFVFQNCIQYVCIMSSWCSKSIQNQIKFKLNDFNLKMRSVFILLVEFPLLFDCIVACPPNHPRFLKTLSIAFLLERKTHRKYVKINSKWICWLLGDSSLKMASNYSRSVLLFSPSHPTWKKSFRLLEQVWLELHAISCLQCWSRMLSGSFQGKSRAEVLESKHGVKSSCVDRLCCFRECAMSEQHDFCSGETV